MWWKGEAWSRSHLNSLCLSPADETFNLGLMFELVMEVRPRVASGVLMHVSTAEGFFTVYIHQREVRHSGSMIYPVCNTSVIQV